jgi:F0F1-type ATP synthase assembly protein I
MSHPQHRIWIRQVLLQLLLTLLLALILGIAFGGDVAAALIFGSAISIVTTLLSLWHHFRLEQVAENSVGKSMRRILGCAFERIILGALLFAVAFGVLELAPFPLLAGFLIGFLVTVVSEFNTSLTMRRYHGK